jgi:hypothetical protein
MTVVLDSPPLQKMTSQKATIEILLRQEVRGFRYDLSCFALHMNISMNATNINNAACIFFLDFKKAQIFISKF